MLRIFKQMVFVLFCLFKLTHTRTRFFFLGLLWLATASLSSTQSSPITVKSNVVGRRMLVLVNVWHSICQWFNSLCQLCNYFFCVCFPLFLIYKYKIHNHIWQYFFSIIVAFEFAYYCKPEKNFSVEQAERVRNYTFASFFGSLLLFLVAAIAPLLLFYETSTSVATFFAYRDVLGYAAAGLASLQYLPQIPKTLRLRRPGSLSVLSLAIMMFGNVGVFCYLYFMSNAAFSTGLFFNLVDNFYLCSMYQY